MDFNIKPTAYSPSTALSAKEMVALAASLWVQMGVDITLIKQNGIPDDNRTIVQRKNPYETYLAVLEKPDEVCLGVMTGPKNGLVAMDVFTHSPGQGMHDLVERELICPCCDVVIRNEAFADGQEEHWFHTILLHSGKEQFLGTTIKDLPGVGVRPSGESIPLPPSTMSWGLDLAVETRCRYECHDYIAPGRVMTMSDELRAIIRAAERQTLIEKRKPHLRIGVLPELYAPVAEGARNNELTRRAGHLIGVRNLTETQTLEVLLDINQRCCQPPLGFSEVRNIAHSIAKKHRRHG